jgi:unsaturated rhamnogalacturonyl hydrolase
MLLPPPLAILQLVATSMFRYGKDNSTFFQYNYGPGYAFAALYEAASLSPELNFTKEINVWLDYFLQPGAYGFNITHDIPMPYTGAVGEPTSFAVAYEKRARDDIDLSLAIKTANQYMLDYPYRLSDGTFVRPGGWGNEQGHSFLWGDDQFMSIALLTRLYRRNSTLPNALDYLSVSINNALTNSARVQNADGLFTHGFNTLTNESSCCLWGRANGWIAMSLIELLTALPESHPSQPAVLNVLVRLASGLQETQDKSDGRWHQVLNESSTFLETSATAMFTFALSTAVTRGWLPRDPYYSVATAGWSGLLKAIHADGEVEGICQGTPVLLNVAEYNARTTLYNMSDPGLGAVMRAALSINEMG